MERLCALQKQPSDGLLITSAVFSRGLLLGESKTQSYYLSARVHVIWHLSPSPLWSFMETQIFKAMGSVFPKAKVRVLVFLKAKAFGAQW